MSLNKTWIALAVAAVTLAGGLLFTFDWLTDQFVPPAEPFVVAAEGGVAELEPPRPLDDFTLTSHTGEPLSLSDLRGRPVVLSFGYTYCPDVCPLTMMEYRQLHQMLGEQADDVQFVFVSVDGERDTPERLRDYLQARSADFVQALTGNDGEIQRMGVDYGLNYEKQTDTGSAAFYIIDHTANTYLIDGQGRLTTIFGFGTATQTVYERIRDLL